MYFPPEKNNETNEMCWFALKIIFFLALWKFSYLDYLCSNGK